MSNIGHVSSQLIPAHLEYMFGEIVILFCSWLIGQKLFFFYISSQPNFEVAGRYLAV